jgi:Transcription factor subunit Med10 of Mediator complex
MEHEAVTGLPESAEGVDSGGTALVELERSLENACETLAAIAGGVLEFTYDGQELLFTKVNDFVRDLAHLDAKALLVNAEVPVEVLEAIDVGRNPEHCTYQML